jgi:hypothetical protein
MYFEIIGRDIIRKASYDHKPYTLTVKAVNEIIEKLDRNIESAVNNINKAVNEILDKLDDPSLPKRQIIS